MFEMKDLMMWLVTLVALVLVLPLALLGLVIIMLEEFWNLFRK
tara:strand:- start:190 stop:318 length:129 start_codon:yes stop_codon:yes gene_type:complete